MKVLLAYRYHEWVTGRWLEAALKTLGHDVRTLGPTIGERTLDIPTSGPRLDVEGTFLQLAKEGWEADCFVMVDSGTLYPFGVSRLPCPTVFFGTDPDLAPRYTGALSRLFDVGVVSQKGDRWIFEQAGCRTVLWIPYALHPPMLTDAPRADDYDVVLIGSPYPQRLEAERRLSREFRFFLGYIPPEDQCQMYRSGRIGLNVSRRGEINSRTFEIMAFGVPLLTDTDPRHGLLDLFEDGHHLITFSSLDECESLVRKLVKDRAWRDEISAAGRAEVLANHTWKNRAETLMASIEEASVGPRKRRLEERAIIFKAKVAQSRFGVRLGG